VAPGLGLIDWGAPWNAPFRSQGERALHTHAGGCDLPSALNEALAASVRFVPQSELLGDQAYEAFIFEHRCVPTREGLHDFFNALVWARFPLSKRRLNALQAAEIAHAGVGQVRGKVRDAITVLDENAALLQAPDALWRALREREWSLLFGDLRPLWAQARLVLFGHALLEKLVNPYKSITAHVVDVAVPPALGEDLSAWDAWLVHELQIERLAGKPFVPLPVLGVPGWWPANTDPDFYADAGVFRPRRVAVPVSGS
jgi:hypothetical protein